ncbi:hypothetical protein [Pseudomonas viridiflava]|uniref:hypothetical protein n=1 Tax=Pseudomonas viridiflava TaxID=33069 RepID=UPI000F06262C|nr:hypothetical protein [Pseudomonas viridiflava]
MDNAEQCHYEQAALRARKGFLLYAALAILAPIAAVAICYVFERPSTWIGRGGAIMAGLAFLADMKARDMAAVFKPSGYVGVSFTPTRTKYLPQISIFLKLSVGLVLLGTAVWGFGDLLPVGAPPSQ